MTRLPKFTISLAVQAVLLVFAMDDEFAPIYMTALCTVWNLVLILDWGLCRFAHLHREAMMLSLPLWLLCGLPVVFLCISLSTRWKV